MNAWIRAGMLAACVAACGVTDATPTDDPSPVERALRAEDHPRAERLARSQLAASEASAGPSSARTLEAIDTLVDVLLDGERIETPDLEAMLGREETLAAELAGNESREYARALMRRTAWLGQRRDYPGFIRTTHAAGALAARWPGDAALAEIELQGGYSRYYFEGDSVDGAARVRRQLDLLKRMPSTGPRLLSTALRMHARMQFDAQNLDEALRAMREFEEHARVHFGLRSARRSYALTWLGYTLRESGRYTEGIDALREGATLAAGVRPYRQALHVEAMNALAQNLAIVGDTGTARAEFERALAIEERHPSANGYLLGLLLGSLGTLRGNEGDIQAASEYFARAIPIYERVFGAGSPKAVVMRKNYAETLQNLERLDEATPIYERIIADHDRNPGAHAGSAALLPYKNFATLRLWQRRYGEAEALYRRFLDLLGDGRGFSEINPRTATAGLAAALWGQGRHREAFAQAREAQRIVVRARRNALDQLSERQLLAFDRSQHDVAGLAVAIAADSRDSDLLGQAWQLQMDGSGYVTRAIATRLALATANGRDAELWQQWRALSDALSTARVAAGKAPSTEALAAVDRAQDELDAVERRIAHAGVGRPSLVAEQGDLAAAVAGLPSDALLVRFLEITDSAPDRYQRGAAGERARLFALARTRATAARAIDLGPASAIAARVGSWYALASDPHANERAASDAAKALRRALLDPIAADAGIARMFVIPSASLSRVNFAALVDEQDRPLVDSGPTFHLLNHERELLAPPRPERTPRLLLAGAGERMHATGTPLASRMRKACPGIGAGQLDPLPGAAREIAALRAIAADRVDRIDVLSGAVATEAAVRAAMPGQSIVHLATHAFALGGRCDDSEVSRSIALDLPRRPNAEARPLSALAFPPGAASDDGLLTGEEIATLDLSAAEWVVLSACETALGETRGDEGVFGLRRAFRLAGAGAVVMSLWRVEDRATAEFMQSLYRARLVDGADTPTAMREATRAVRAARARRGESLHPLYWAGFVAAGHWR